MEEIRTSIDNHGKVLIPAKLRKELQFKRGDILVVRKVNNELRLMSLNSVLSKIQHDFKLRSTSKKSAVSEFLELKKNENQLEERKLSKFDTSPKSTKRG